MNEHYIYLHRRCDNNEIFYVGAAKHQIKLAKYRRAYIKSRPKEWKDIVEKTAYIVDIIFDNLTEKEAFDKEVLLIAKYGRKDYEGGTLINRSVGGKSSSKGYKQTDHAKELIRKFQVGKIMPKDVVEKIRQKNIGKKRSDSVKLQMSIYRKGRQARGASPTAKKVLNTATGQEYDCVKDAADAIGLAYPTLYAKLVGKWKVNDTPLIYKQTLSMNHTDLLNYLASKHSLKSFLELGVQNPANNFNKIQCKYKVGVDPAVKNDIRIYEGTSNQYFTGYGDRRYDLIFIDGLHHADQVKRDFENSLRCLNDGGRIVIHDCLPDNEIETCIPRGNQKKWMGDVYKFIFKLNSYDNIDFCTYNFDCGCCVVWRDETKKGKFVNDLIDWDFYINNKEMMRIANKIS